MSSKGRVSKAGLAALNKELYGHIYSCRKTLRRLLTFGSHRQLCGFSFTILPFLHLSLFPIRFLPVHYFFSVFLTPCSLLFRLLAFCFYYCSLCIQTQMNNSLSFYSFPNLFSRSFNFYSSHSFSF